jgi:CheY-like chemotaxis protein
MYPFRIEVQGRCASRVSGHAFCTMLPVPVNANQRSCEGFAEGVQMDKATNEALENIAGKSRRYILLVTASSDDLYSISMLLQRFTYPVCTAQTARQALDIISVALPALVITDLVLPDMSGLEMLRNVKGDVRTLPILLLLPGPDEHVEKRMVEIGGSVPCLTKPVRSEDLYRAVQAVIEATPRAHVRIPTQLPVMVNNIPLDASRGEYIMNISEHGLFVRMLKPARRDDRVLVEMNISGHVVKVHAVVLHSRRAGEGPFRDPGMAVRFAEIAPGNQEIIRKFIHDEVTRGIQAESE